MPNPSKNLNKIAIVVGTHGDEFVDLNSDLKSGKNEYYRWEQIVANPKAVAKNKRFIDVDLNRSFPGDGKSAHHEQKLAVKLSQKLQNYDIVLDIHKTTSYMPDTLFINSVQPKSLELLQYLPFEYIIWDNWNPKPFLTGVVENSCCLELSRTGDLQEEKLRAEKYINSILNQTKHNLNQQIFESTTISIPRNKGAEEMNLENFKSLTKEQKKHFDLDPDLDLYTIFVDEKVYSQYAFVVKKLPFFVNKNNQIKK